MAQHTQWTEHMPEQYDEMRRRERDTLTIQREMIDHARGYVQLCLDEATAALADVEAEIEAYHNERDLGLHAFTVGALQARCERCRSAVQAIVAQLDQLTAIGDQLSAWLAEARND